MPLPESRKHIPTLLGGIFLYSGIYKSLYPGEATAALIALDIPPGVASGTILLLTVAEVYLGILLVFKAHLRLALCVTTGLLLGFSLFLFFLASMAHPPSCGCMGLTAIFKSNRDNAVAGLLRNCILLWLTKSTLDYFFPKLETADTVIP